MKALEALKNDALRSPSDSELQNRGLARLRLIQGRAIEECFRSDIAVIISSAVSVYVYHIRENVSQLTWKCSRLWLLKKEFENVRGRDFGAPTLGQQQ